MTHEHIPHSGHQLQERLFSLKSFVQFFVQLYRAIEMKRQNKKLDTMAEPSIENMFKIMEILQRKREKNIFTDVEGNIVEVIPTIIRGLNDGTASHGMRIKVRQILPKEYNNHPLYLTMTFSFDPNFKNEILFNSCVSFINNQKDFERTGDLRTDELYRRENVRVNIGFDGNDDGVGIPTGEYVLNDVSFEGALQRAYALILSLVFNRGEVDPLVKKPTLTD